MTKIAQFVFSPFQENTYVLYDDTKECVIIDPGCYDAEEERELSEFIESAGLTPVRLLNTHCHIDHVFGNRFVSETYHLGVECHEGELKVLNNNSIVAGMYGLNLTPSPPPRAFINDGDVIQFGGSRLEALLVPGHSPASLCFFCRASNFLIAGDTLFKESIGRTDLPGGNLSTLIRSIREKLLPLGDDVRVYPGHMGPTSIGHERERNPFVGVSRA